MTTRYDELVERMRIVADDSGYYETCTEAADAIEALQAECAKLREALHQIAKGEGAFNRDQLTFANNVIDEAKATAHAALAAHGEKP